MELVLPDSIGSIPVERIIDIRRESELAFQKFRSRIAEMRTMLAAELDGIEDLETAEAVVRDVRDRTIGVDLEILRQTLRAQNLVTTTQTLGMQISVGAGIAGIAVSLSGMPILGLGSARSSVGADRSPRPHQQPTSRPVATAQGGTECGRLHRPACGVSTTHPAQPRGALAQPPRKSNRTLARLLRPDPRRHTHPR